MKKMIVVATKALAHIVTSYCIAAKHAALVATMIVFLICSYSFVLHTV